jgi:hypothetical protein
MALLGFVRRLNLMNNLLRFQYSCLWRQLCVWSEGFHCIFVVSLLGGQSCYREKFWYQVNVSWLFSDLFVFDHLDRLFINFYKRLLHVFDHNSICFLEILSVCFFYFRGHFSWLFSFSDFMNVEIGVGIFSLLNAVDLVSLVVSIPRNDHRSFEFCGCLPTHVSDNLKEVRTLKDSGARINL